MLSTDEKRRVLACEKMTIRERRIIADWDDDWGSSYTTRSESLFGVMEMIHGRVKVIPINYDLMADANFKEFVELMRDLLDSPIPYTNGAFARSACPPDYPLCPWFFEESCGKAKLRRGKKGEK